MLQDARPPVIVEEKPEAENRGSRWFSLAKKQESITEYLRQYNEGSSGIKEGEGSC
jgi:hypothetical protein